MNKILLYILLGVLLCSFASAVGDITSDLTVHYDFETQSAGVVDDLMDFKEATVIGNDRWFNDTDYGRGWSFSGDDGFIDMGDSLEDLNVYTYCFLLNATKLTETIFGESTTGTSGTVFRSGSNGTTSISQVGGGVDTLEQINEDVVTLCNAVDGSNLVQYINGILKINVSYTVNLFWKQHQYIGSFYWDKSPYYHEGYTGYMFDFRVYNKTFNEDDALLYHNTMFSISSSGLADITLLTPTNNTYDNTLIQNFSYNVSCDDCIVNSCSLLLNDTLILTNNTITNATVNYFNGITLVEGENEKTIYIKMD